MEEAVLLAETISVVEAKKDRRQAELVKCRQYVCSLTNVVYFIVCV